MKGTLKITKTWMAAAAAMLIASPVQSQGFDPSGYALFSATSSIQLNNMSSTNITGNVRAQASTCTFNNLSSITVTGNVVCSGALKFNNISSGNVSGVAQSSTSVSIRGVTISGGSTVVNSISSATLSNLSAPTSTSDANYMLPITIVTGDYTISGPTTLNGTIYATGNIHVNNGNISGTGALVAGGSVHLNNLSSVGSSSAKLFFYSLGTGGIHFNNISSITVRGTLYAPLGNIHLNNISSVNVTGGILGKDIQINNVSSLILGPGSVMNEVIPPGIINPVTIPSAPSNLTASAASFTSVALSWIDNSTNETSFRVERSSNGVSFVEIGSVAANATSYTDSGLVSNSTYYYRVRARNSAGDSSYTNIASATLLSPPNAPTSLVATSSGDSIGLSWADNSSNEASFRIERSTNGTSFTEIGYVAANVNTYTDSSLSAGTYYYRVRARNSAGDSDYSNTANAAITVTSDPCDPTIAGSGFNSYNTYVATVELCGMVVR